jgi:hypothetical protein
MGTIAAAVLQEEYFIVIGDFAMTSGGELCVNDKATVFFATPDQERYIFLVNGNSFTFITQPK